MDEQEPQISPGTKWMMLAIAIFVDIFLKPSILLLDFIFIGTPLNWAIDIGMFLLYYIWFKSNGIDFTKKKRGLSLLGGYVIEFIPWVNALIPAWTASVAYIIYSTKIKAIVGNLPVAELGRNNTQNVAQAQRRSPSSQPQKTTSTPHFRDTAPKTNIAPSQKRVGNEISVE